MTISAPPLLLSWLKDNFNLSVESDSTSKSPCSLPRPSSACLFHSSLQLALASIPTQSLLLISAWFVSFKLVTDSLSSHYPLLLGHQSGQLKRRSKMAANFTFLLLPVWKNSPPTLGLAFALVCFALDLFGTELLAFAGLNPWAILIERERLVGACLGWSNREGKFFCFCFFPTLSSSQQQPTDLIKRELTCFFSSETSKQPYNLW